jgi:hypothetical protein
VKLIGSSHWLAFLSSTAALMVTFGIVPLQAGIFSTRTLTRDSPEMFSISNAFIDARDQQTELTIHFAQSAYDILTWNETLPPYMNYTYTLAPFALPNRTPQLQETWVANTTLYSVDLQCEETRRTKDSRLVRLNSTLSGCGVPLDRRGNYTIDNSTEPDSSRPRVKRYSADYIGYWYNTDWTGKSQSSLLSLTYFCDRGEPANETFFAAFSKNKEKEDDPANPPAALFCRPSYYEQSVQASIDASSKAPLEIITHGSKRPLSPGIFDQEDFQNALYLEEKPMFAAPAFSTQIAMRTNNLPTVKLPRYLDMLSVSEITVKIDDSDHWDLPVMAAMAIMAGDRDLNDYLDPKVLAESYEKAYRLLFARYMTEVFTTDFKSDLTNTPGHKHVVTEAVVLESVFVYIVEGLLAAVSIAGLGLLYFSLIRKKKLSSDPGR